MRLRGVVGISRFMSSQAELPSVGWVEYFATGIHEVAKQTFVAPLMLPDTSIVSVKLVNRHLLLLRYLPLVKLWYGMLNRQPWSRSDEDTG